MWRHRRVSERRYYGRKLPEPLAVPCVDKASTRTAHWRSKPEWACKKVIHFASHGWSCRNIEGHFDREHGEYMTVGPSWVAEYIKAHALEIAERRREMHRRPPRWFKVNHTWALDLTFLVNEQGLSFAMLGIIDHGSRRLLCLKQLPRKCTLTLLRVDRTICFESHLYAIGVQFIMVFIETPTFTRQVALLLSGEEYRQLQNALVVDPACGALIKGGGGLRKIRHAVQGRGKSGGVRAIYYWLTEHDQICWWCTPSPGRTI
jgi:hypothetical protein